MEYHVVKYTGPFGFIKPWTAVRDSETFSQQFLTPSIVEGMEKKLFPELLGKPGIHKILRHRLSYQQMASQQEQVQPRGWNRSRIDGKKAWVRKYAVTIRSVLLSPVLWLAFEEKEAAEQALGQHICLCRNEDILYPESLITVPASDFDQDSDAFPGYELIFEQNEQSFLVGYNRGQDAKPMYGWLKVVGTPVKSLS
ncbi:MAG: hypothetical protein AAF399_18070 [Bacteroidota bacterium]